MAPSVFFREWDDRRSGERRSLGRAGELAARLGVPEPGTPVLAVVGSKGKGTCATFASACLAAAGRRVVTITSPGLRTHRERIRVGGRAVSEPELSWLAERLEAAMPRRVPGAGYLSPSGLFMIAGLLHARRVAADAIVVEAGRGGLSDEVSLFPADVVAITAILGEHLGELGDSLEEIARDKAGIVTARTRAVLACPQSPELELLLTQLIGGRTALRILRPGGVPDRLLRSGGVPDGLLPAGLNGMNAELGCAAARRLLDLAGGRPAGPGRLARVLETIRLPGRLSLHTLPGTATRILLDSAVTREATAAALAAARREFGAIDHVLLSLPDDKDLDGAVAELAGLPGTFVRLARSHLRFTRPAPAGWPVTGPQELTAGALARLGRRIVALGTVSFTAVILDLVDAPTERLFTP